MYSVTIAVALWKQMVFAVGKSIILLLVYVRFKRCIYNLFLKLIEVNINSI